MVSNAISAVTDPECSVYPSSCSSSCATHQRAAAHAEPTAENSACCIVQEKAHTIILVQRNQNKGTRTFLDYDGVPAAVDGMLLNG